MDALIIILLLLILAQTTDTGTAKEKDEKRQTDYIKGRIWACREYYRLGRSIDHIRDKIPRSYDYTDFERGVLDVLDELRTREGLEDEL